MSAYSSEPEAYDESVLYTCRRCQCKTRSLEHDGEHGECEREGAIDHARAREAQRQLHRDTARLLRQLGHAERAQVHDTLAEGRW